MIRIFTLNISEEILNKFKDFEIHNYYVNFCVPTAIIYEDDRIVKQIENADYDRINTCIIELGGRTESS